MLKCMSTLNNNILELRPNISKHSFPQLSTSPKLQIPGGSYFKAALLIKKANLSGI